ncbi:MAG TPA: hypothetical protein DHW64_04210 [Chitinophagaceae bacterium]|nr:hypothetical protein [Chitinophagaceae bacterium]
MHKLYIISYNGSNSSAIKETVKLHGAWFSHFDNQYLLCSTSNIATIKSALDTKIVQGVDRLLILEVELKEVKGWINKNGWDWIKNQREKLKH